jgi:hypothetical protein
MNVEVPAHGSLKDLDDSDVCDDSDEDDDATVVLKPETDPHVQR